MTGIVINGETVSVKDCAALIKMLYGDAVQVAGTFHGMNRSPKFRKNWPNEYLFAESEWKNFVVATRDLYLDRIKDPLTNPADAKKMFQALYLERLASQGQETDQRLQIKPDSQQFVGDPFENRKIVEKFGDQSNSFHELAMGTTALVH